MIPVCLPEKYEIIGTLGHGGMGTVWHARDKTLDRNVALKVLSDKLAEDPFFVQRFTTEAKAAARLNHPNIVQIYEYFQTDHGHFLAMELIDGPSLKEELKRRGRFTETETVNVGRKACSALAVAHAAGIVHRDIKPENMMFTRQGDFKLVDLGLAKNLNEDVSQTVTGTTMGTPHFISPEQILGASEIDQRADIYSLGATLYNLATGALPFDGSSGAHIMSLHLNEPLRDPRHAAPDLSVAFCRVLGRMMAKDPKDRYQSASALDEDLERLQVGRKPGPIVPVASAVQDTVFNSFHEADSGSGPVHWDQEDLRRVTSALARHVGPLAPVLVRKARVSSTCRADLVAELAAHIGNEADREAFRAKCRRLENGGQTTEFPVPDQSDSGVTVTLGSSAQGAMQPGAQCLYLDDESRARIIQALAKHVGPVARILVKREAEASYDMADLTARLLANVTEEPARIAFQEVMRNLE
jgi:hypothetical protein